MEAMWGPTLRCSPWTGSDTIKENSKVAVGVAFSSILGRQLGVPRLDMSNLKGKKGSNRQKKFLILSHCCKDSHAPISESGIFYSSFDASWSLKLQRKAQELASLLDGRCIFLVGMMGSGKSTVGKILSEALGYIFVDSDHYVEQAMGGTSVAQIFKQCSENFFRDNESEALRKLSLMSRHVIATGGGAVVRSINWTYMRQGITVFLDVPLDALARRIAAVGTDSRPLLHFDSGDAYTQAFLGLFTLSKKRGEAYSNADATVSVLHLATKLGLEDFCDITPTMIAYEALIQIEQYLRGNNSISAADFP